MHRIAALHAGITGGALRMPVLAALDRVLPRGPLPTVRAELAPGVCLELDGAGAIARAALIAGGYEQREVEALAGALRPGGVFIDVGANIGWFTVLVALHRPSAAVWAIEPIAATADLLAGHVARAEGVNVRVIRAAATARDGHVRLRATTDNAFAHQAEDGDNLVRCAAVTLDTLWHTAGRPRVDAVKIDVEGGELGVLAGARTLLGEHRPLLVVETPTAAAVAAVVDELLPYGYRRRRDRGLLPYNICLTAEST